MTMAYGFFLKDDNAFKNMPAEMYFHVFGYLDKDSMLNSRCVSKTWKYHVDYSRRLTFYCELTDETISHVIKSTETFPIIKIHDFMGKRKTVVSATRGTGRIFVGASNIQMIGKNINIDEVIRMMKYAVSVENLTFTSCENDLIKSTFRTCPPYDSLTKLEFVYKSFPNVEDTKMLDELSNSPWFKLPSLEHLKISQKITCLSHAIRRLVPSARLIFKNYLAIGKLIVRLKDSLRTVQILRNEILRTALVLSIDTTMHQISEVQRLQIQSCVDAFDEMNLTRVHIAPLLDEGDYPWILETSLLQRQRNLREVCFDKKLCFPQPGSQILTNLLPTTAANFTSVKIAVTCLGPEPVDLGLFSRCANLHTLWLVYFRGVRIGPARQNSLHFVNLEQLPTTIASLHFKSSKEESIIIHQQSILSQAQLEWIIRNLLNLQSFWLQLVVEEVLHENDFRPVEMAQEGELEMIRRVIGRFNEDLNSVANVNLQLFQQMLTMPNLKEMKFDIMKAAQLGAILEDGENAWVLPVRPIAIADIREYVEVCELLPNVTCRPEVVSFFPFRFVELAVSKYN